MSEMPGSITVYKPEMAEAVAQMFNDFNELWPGGFGGGIPYDANRVHDFLDQTSAVADLVALDETGQPVGYCGLYPHWRDADTAFITILGVVPRVKGHKFGRRLLLHAFNLATDRGFQKVDLGTWPGNLDAVPLYKKTGLFWVPDTNVYMQNFIPGLSQIPLARSWFEKHPDWYACYQRELAQAPDDETVNGMAVYTYRFQVGEDRLQGRVDRYGWGVCEIESVLNGQRIALKTRLDSHTILMGIPNALTITIENGSPESLEIALNVEAFKGLYWQQSFPLAVQVPAGETLSITRPFLTDFTAQPYRNMERSPVIRTRLIFSGQVIELTTGGKIQPAVELVSHQGYQTVQPGRGGKVHLDLKNNANQPLRGNVDVFVEGLSEGVQTFVFELQPNELSGLVIPTPDIPQAGSSLVLHACPTIEIETGLTAMPVYKFPLVINLPGSAISVIENDGRHLHLLTDWVDVRVDLEGGDISLGPRDLPGIRRPANFQAGPPFGMGPDSALPFSPTLQVAGNTSDAHSLLVLSAESRQFPGLRIQKYVRVIPGSKEIAHWVVLTNLTSRSDLTVGGRMHTTSYGGISINPFSSIGRSFTPVDGRVIMCDAQLPLMNDNMLPQNPENWPETWAAGEGLAHGELAAHFWDKDGIEKIKVRNGMLSTLEASTRQLKPGEASTIFHLWYGFGYSSAEEVRLRWNQLIGGADLPLKELQSLETFPPVQVRWAENRTLARGIQNERQVEIHFVSLYPLSGTLGLSLPDRWDGGFIAENGSIVDSLPMPEPTPGKPGIIRVMVDVPAGEACTCAVPVLKLSGEYEMDFPLPALLESFGASGRNKVDINRQEREGRPVIAVDNGALNFLVMADVGGCLIRLQDAHGHTYLSDNFPEIEPHFFLPYHVGGLQPLHFTMDAQQSFTALEKVRAEAVREGPWQGVRVAWTSQHQPELQGQDFSIAYLTLPGSEVVRIRFRHHNHTSRRIEWVGSFFANLAFEGSLEGITIHAPGGTQVWRRNWVPKPFIGLTNMRQPWAHFSRGEQSLLLAGTPRTMSHITAMDFNQVIGGLLVGIHQSEPYSEGSLEFITAINQPASKAMQLIESVQA